MASLHAVTAAAAAVAAVISAVESSGLIQWTMMTTCSFRFISLQLFQNNENYTTIVCHEYFFFIGIFQTMGKSPTFACFFS